MGTKDKRFGRIGLAMCLLVSLGLVAPVFAGKGGGGKPPKDEPAPDPVIVTTITQKGKRAIMVMNADGSNQTVVGPGLWRPSWSPDGTRLAFGDWGVGECPLHGIYVVTMDASFQWGLPQTLACIDGTIGKPEWHPQPEGVEYRIAYPHYPDFDPAVSESRGDVFVVDFNMNDSGSIAIVGGPTNVTNNQAVEHADTVWSPDGTKVAVVETVVESDLTAWDDVVVYDLVNGNPPRSLIQGVDGSPLNGIGGFEISGIAWAVEHELLAVKAAGDIWCIDASDGPTQGSAINLTAPIDPSDEVREGVPSWTAGDTGIAYGVARGIILLEFPVQETGCPTEADMEFATQSTVIEGKEFSITERKFPPDIDWWRNWVAP